MKIDSLNKCSPCYAQSRIRPAQALMESGCRIRRAGTHHVFDRIHRSLCGVIAHNNDLLSNGDNTQWALVRK